jgi:hypothetical protein
MSNQKQTINKVLLAGSYKYEFYAPAWKKGLERIGINVVCFDWDQLWSTGIIKYLEQRFLVGSALLKINRGLLNEAERTNPDVILIYAGQPIWPKTVRKLSQKYWVAGYHNDNPFGTYGKKAFFRYFKESIPYYSSHHVYREENLTEYRLLGVKRVALLRSFFCPWLNYPVDKSNIKEYPVVFVGNGEPGPRKKYISYLVEKGVPVKLFGHASYWKRFLPRKIYKKLSPITPAVDEDYNAIIKNAKISLAFFNSGNNDMYTRRVFEIPACKGFLLAQRTPTMLNLYKEGKEAEYFSDEMELIDKINFYLRNEDARKKIVEAGYKRCLNSGYDVVSRMKQWLRDTEMCMTTGV